MKFTKEQIEGFKSKYGKVWLFELEGEKSCILKRAGRNEISLANITAITRNDDGNSNFDVNKFNESIVLSTWVAGDEEVKINDKLFLGLVEKLGILIEKSQCEVKEL